MKKAAIYLRVSTLDQEYDRQQYELKQLATALGYEVVKVYEEKKSGVLSMDTRDELEKMRKLTSKDVERIFIWDISRLSRKASDFITLVNEFSEKKICLHFKDKNIITLDDKGEIDGLASIYLYILGVFAQMDAENLKAKFKSGKENALRKGNSYTNNAPFGYYLENKQLQILEDEAKYVRLAFDLYKEGRDLQYIADIFNSKQVPLKSKRKDIVWVKGTIYQMLKNTVYMGKGQYVNTQKDKETNKRVPTSTRYFDTPVIIAEDLFQAVQKQFNKNRSIADKGSKIESLLRGTIKCAVCGKHHIFAYNNGNYMYLDADVRANVNNKIGCKNGSINKDVADALVWEAVKNIYKEDIFKLECEKDRKQNKDKYAANETEIVELRVKIDDLAREKTKINTAYIKGLFTDEELFTENERVRSENDRINKILTEKIAENGVLLDKINFEYNYDDFNLGDPTFEEKKQICKDLIYEVELLKYNSFKSLLHITLKVGLVYNVLIDTFHSSNNYFIFNNWEILPMMKQTFPAEVTEQIGDITNDFKILKNDIIPEYRNQYLTYEELWDIIKNKNLLKPIKLNINKKNNKKGN